MQCVSAFEEAINAKESQRAIRMARNDLSLLKTPVSGGGSPLAAAAYAGAWDLVRWMAEMGGICNVADAILADDAELASTMLNAHPQQVGMLTHDGFSLLHLAVYFGRDALALDLISRGADVNIISNNELRTPPLHAAIAGEAGDNVIAALIEQGAQIHGGDLPPLHLAAANGRLGAVRLLLAAGADRRELSREGKTAGDCAHENGHSELVELLA